MRTVTGKLQHGMTIEGVAHKEFEMREVSTGDLLDAENDAPVSKPLNFATALLTRQLLRIGDFTGPFTVGMLRKLDPVDYWILRDKQTELDRLGEPVSGAPGTS